MSHEATSALRQFASDKAAVELLDKAHTTRRVIQELKIAQRDRLAELARAAGLREPEMLAGELHFSLEGARCRVECRRGGLRRAADPRRRSDDRGA
jgi:hypothetical protein